MKKNNKILIVCYSFPPHPGIGGRRWVKFSKLLSLKGYEIFVVSAKNVYDHSSLWYKDVDVKKIKLNPFNFKFQQILKSPRSITDKFLRKLIYFFANKTKYTADIITSFPNKHIWEEVKKLIVEQKINKVIVSGDPYLFYNVSLLKKEIDFDLTLDYRDLWNDHAFYETNVSLSRAQKKYFEYVENYAVNNCNKIIFVDEHLKEVVKKRITSNSVSTFVLHNGFDSDDHYGEQDGLDGHEGITIFFAGSISSDLNESLLQFIKIFGRLSGEKPHIYSKISISIFGEMDKKLFEQIKNLKLARVQIKNELLGNKEYYQRVKNADVGLVILSEEYKNSFITKFTDYLFYDKFTIALGYKGLFADYIERHNIGIGFDQNVNDSFFEDLIARINIKQPIPAEEKNEFDLKYLTEKLVECVIEN